MNGIVYYQKLNIYNNATELDNKIQNFFFCYTKKRNITGIWTTI